MVCGKTSLAKEVFGETLNESRDPDRPPERYTSRYYLKFTFLEQAFDKLADAGFHMVACNSTGTCAFAHEQTDDKIWTSYTEYVFYLGSSVNSKTTTSDHPALTGALTSTATESVPPSPPTSVTSGPASASATQTSSTSIHAPTSSTPPPAESPHRPTTLHLKTLPRPTVRENGGPALGVDEDEDERKLLEEDLKKCIEDFRKIRLPRVFPDRKRHWQSDLLKKYNA
ncbi:unnamed protein product [Pleuronectes platessa]|uniref:KCTD8/12/16 H1 domain-containing protein n=1 Tax=Pleuronectes platessa TaxID=8262 RepID=A0A9N7ZC18_PLEPL|nr:unnamed protein product [Pleuronectes platessa]